MGKIETVSLTSHTLKGEETALANSTIPGLVTTTTLQSQYWPCDCLSPRTWALFSDVPLGTESKC